MTEIQLPATLGEEWFKVKLKMIERKLRNAVFLPYMMSQCMLYNKMYKSSHVV